MGDEWSNQRLADVVELIGGGTPKRNHSDYWGGDIPWLSVRDFNNDNRYVYFTEETITEEGVKNSSTKILSPGQIIISARGTVGALAQLVRPMAFNQSCYGINAKDGTFNDYLFYLLKHTVANLQRITHGAVFDTITRETFQHVEIALPSLPEQRAIAHILGSLDDKIELNRQMAQTLESIARAIFKSWFVDFDPVKAKMEGKQPEGMTEEIAALFPDRLVDSELGMIPEGGDTIVLSEIVDIHSGGTPKTKVSEYWNGTIPWYSVVDAPNDGEVFVVTTSKSITDMGLNNSSTKILPIGSTIISARGTVGKLAVTCSKMTMNQSCYALKGLYGDFFTYYTISEEVDWLKQNAHGAVFDTITRATFKEISIVLPNTEIIRMYESLVLPLMERIKVLLYESNTLAELRDTLLPRLISGNIRVNQPEDAAE